MSNQLEVCLDNSVSIDVINQHPIKRIELCSALGLDGLTPTHSLVNYAKKYAKAELHAMVRPRAGDFYYSQKELEQMQAEVHYFGKLGFDGVVFGCLQQNQSLDIDSLTSLIETAKQYQMEITIHRAIDLVPNYFEAIAQCIVLGVTRILTSGHAQTVELGQENLTKAIERYGRDIQIMAGGGVRLNNIVLLKKLGVTHFHTSASREICIGNDFSVFPRGSLAYRCTDDVALAQMVKAIHS